MAWKMFGCRTFLPLLMNSTKPLTPPAGEVVFLAAVALVDRRMRTPLFRKESSRRRLARIS
jgi:hypothetical protein